MSANPGYRLSDMDTYETLYWTCLKCNNIMVVVRDVSQQDPSRSDRFSDTNYSLKAKETGVPHSLPQCSKCKSTTSAQIGVHDFEEMIEEERARMIEMKRCRDEAVLVLQSFSRTLASRREYNRLLYEQQCIVIKKNQAIILIQKRVRGIICRRQCFIKRCLFLIKTMHPLIFAHAITNHCNEELFPWYGCQSNVDILHKDYCDNERHHGTVWAVLAAEKSVIELVEHMLRRERYLVCRMQAAWKGLVQRRVYLKLHRERGLLNSLHYSNAIKIQQLYRSYIAKAHCKRIRQKKLLLRHKRTYLLERNHALSYERAKRIHAQAQSSYQIQFQYKRTLRQLGAPAFGIEAEHIRRLQMPRSRAKVFCVPP